jgi:RNA polymerase sigma-70 factor (ECF subfamily)
VHAPAAFRQQLLASIPRLRRYARALTRSPDAADDLVQDCLERAWRKFDRWEPGTDLRAWLFTLMHNVFVNGVRRRRIETEPMTDSDFEDRRQPGPDRGVALRDLEAAVSRLPPEQREVLLLVCLEEMTYEQVAVVLGVPVGTVMSRLHRARKRVRELLQDEQRPPLRRVK